MAENNDPPETPLPPPQEAKLLPAPKSPPALDIPKATIPAKTEASGSTIHSDSDPKPSKWKLRWMHFIDLVSSFNPFIDVARKHAVYLAEHESEGFSMKKAWYRFGFFMCVVACFAFYGGCEIQSYFDPKNAESSQSQPPDQTIKNQLEETNRQLVVMRKISDENYDKYIAVLTATNSFASDDDLRSVDDYLKQQDQNMTSNESLEAKEQRLKNERKLEGKMQADNTKQMLEPIYPYLKYGFSRYEEILTNAAKSYGMTNFDLPAFPSSDSILGTIDENLVACNGWSSSFELRGNFPASLRLMWTGNKSKSAFVLLQLDRRRQNLNVFLDVDGDSIGGWWSSTKDAQKSVSNIDEAFRLFNENMAADMKN